MRFIFNSCPSCYVYYNGLMEEVKNDASSIKSNNIRCRNCGWIGTWNEITKLTFSNKGEKEYE